MEARQRKPRGQVQEEDYLEEEEQEEVIAAFERQAAHQARYAHQLVGLLGLILAATYFIFAAHQALWPWGLRHHAAFEGSLKPSAVVTGELGGGAAVLLATLSLLAFQPDQPQRLWKQLLQLGGTLAMFEAIFWAAAIYRVVKEGGSHVLGGLWRLAWLPFAPLVFVLVIMNTINSLAALTPELAVLKASKYRYKKA